jgi:hypothetical protein
MRLPSLLLLTGAVLLAGANIWITLSRSTIPLALDGEIREVEVRLEKNPGIDDVYLVSVDGRRIHVDRAVGIRLRSGMQVSKAAWDRVLRTSRGPVPLRPSQDTRRMVAAMPLIVLATALLCFGGRRR